MFEFLGHLHPVLVHLPIGILLLACFFQLLSARGSFAYLQPSISIVLFWGMLSAVASCITGYLLSHTGDYDEVLVNRHQWLGISVAVTAMLYYLLYKQNSFAASGWVMPVLLIFLIAITGHLGGSLTHGSDYLTAPFRNMVASDSMVLRKPVPDVQEALAYNDIIVPILQTKCYSCHGTAKQKGKLRMDQPELLMKGGKNGIVITEGKAAESELIKRVLLEKADEHHMPPKEKPQLTEKEIALLHWWITSGASFTRKTKDLPQPDQIKPVLLSLQSSTTEKKEDAVLPVAVVEKADTSAIAQLKNIGVVVTPVAAGSNYLQASFVTAARATDKDLQLLLPLKKQLLWLKLSDTKITDAAVVVLAQCSNITRLQLDSTAITDKGLAGLVAISGLQSLNLVNTKITAGGLLALKDMKALRRVYVYKTNVAHADWLSIEKAFPRVKIDTGGYTVPLFATDTTLVKPPKVTGEK